MLARTGAVVLGPVAEVDAALDLLARTDHIDGALLDINLKGEMAFPVADVLIERKIPFLFATGYDREVIPPPYDRIARCDKPMTLQKVVTGLFG